MTYASTTGVPADRSRAEIEKTLSRYGCDQFAYAWDETDAIIMFRAHGRAIRFVLPMPDRNDPEFWRTPTGLLREEGPAEKAWEQATRAAWRSLALVIKAKLQAIESGIVSFEDEFLAHTMLPTGSTVGEWAAKQLDEIAATGQVPELMPGRA